ncbi:MAG TPA: ATP-binding protein [Thermodesulfovibrionales bacterium]|nr:ATP-binding protein [Thermodesulfovibrionales bacterium]
MKGYVVIIGILVLIVSALITLNIFFQQTLQMEMAEQFNKQQLFLANAEASNIQSYVNGLKDELWHIAAVVSELRIREKKEFSRIATEFFRGKDIVKTDIAFIDKVGAVLFAGGDISLKKTEISTLLQKTKGSCAGKSLMEQDSRRLQIITPVCRSGSFEGVVLLSLDIQDIAKEFLSPIKSGSRGYAWMMDGKGDLLFHPTQPGMVGKNLYKTDSSCFKCHKTFDVEKKIIEGKGEYYGRHVAPSGEDKVLAFSAASVGDSKWIVAVSAPYSEVTRTIQRSMKFYSWLIISIFFTTSIVSVMLIFSYRRRVKAEELARHQKELERYAEELERKVNKRTTELVTEKEKLNTIVSAIGSGIILLDLQGKIQWMNQTMYEIAGRDLTGMSCDEICADCTVIGSYFIDDMQTELMLNLFGQKDKYFQVTTAPVKGADGEIHGYIRLLQDVTEMKKMEEQMIHSEKLASLGRLTAGITHEIGNPLTSVFSFVQILKEMEQDEFKKESLETIYFHINRIADILKQLSGFSKTPPVELKPWKVNNLIESSLSLIQYDKRAKDIVIVRDLSEVIPEITTDGNQLSQVIVNIILNAVDAMPEGGTLTIRSSVKDQRIMITFEDTGVGISKENIGRIFDPFFTTKEKGTGLGLAVSYSIIKKLNGNLSVESEVKQGTKFTITLPMNGAK